MFGPPPPDAAPPQGYSRPTSHDDRRRVPMPRRSTKGPLDVDHPPTSQTPPHTSTQHLASPDRLPLPRSPSRGPLPSHSTPHISFSHPAKDFSYLLRSEIFHALDPSDIAPPFRQPLLQDDTPPSLHSLLAHGRFHTAATTAAHLLTTVTRPTDCAQIFDLFYTRLACLTLIHHTQLAAQESKALEDLNAAFYYHEETGAHLAPWELRVLAVRLQALGFGDARRGIIGYYELAREARQEVRQAIKKDREEDVRMWKSRLKDLGVRVAGQLVEMGDFDTAVRHLDTLKDAVEGTTSVDEQLCLVYLRVGNVEAARRCVERLAGHDSLGVLEAMCKMADGSYEDAAVLWRQLHQALPDNAMVSQNLAVCLLYGGNVAEATSILDSLIDPGFSFHTLTFNLSTVYELCGERSRDKKMELADRVASQPPDDVGWEMANVDFKL